MRQLTTLAISVGLVAFAEEKEARLSTRSGEAGICFLVRDVCNSDCLSLAVGLDIHVKRNNDDLQDGTRVTKLVKVKRKEGSR